MLFLGYANSMEQTINRSIKQYDNGLRLVVEQMPNFKSVVLSVEVTVGSGDELPNEQGLSHFCEHMLFKGTKRRTGQQIIDEFSMLSVDYNAWTSESATCYHTKGIADNLEQCMDILSDMYFNLQFTDEDFDKEGDVIVQEICMHGDNPDWLLADELNMAYFKGTKYEHPVAGFAKAIKQYQPTDIYNYVKKHYIAPNTIISLAGDITMERAEKLVQKYFLANYVKTAAKPKVRDNVPAICPAVVQVKKKKDTAQQHVALVFPACNQFDTDRHALKLFLLIFGYDMSSRLFINVREKLGLVYSIRASMELSDIGGYLDVSFSCTPKNTKKVIATVLQEIQKLHAEGITAQELAKAQNFCRVKRLFASESTLATNAHNAEELREYGQIKTTEEYLKVIDALTVADVNAVIKKYLLPEKMSTVVVGK